MISPRRLSLESVGLMLSDGVAERVPPEMLADETWLSWVIKDFVYQTEAYKALSEAAQRWGWIPPMEPLPAEGHAEEASALGR